MNKVIPETFKRKTFFLEGLDEGKIWTRCKAVKTTNKSVSCETDKDLYTSVSDAKNKYFSKSRTIKVEGSNQRGSVSNSLL